MAGDYGTLTSLADHNNQVKQVLGLVPTLDPRLTPTLNRMDTGEPVTGERGILNWHEKQTRAVAGTIGADQDAVETQLTLATGEGINVGRGDVIRVGTEDEMVIAMAGDVAVVRRAVLGSTAAAHTSADAWTRITTTFEEDDDLEAAGVVDTDAYYNYVQHFVKTFQSTLAEQEIKRYGGSSKFDDAMVNALKENRSDLNKALFYSVRYLFSPGATAGSLGGFTTFIPQRSDGAFASDAITQKIINNLFEEIMATSGELQSGYSIISSYPMKQAIARPYYAVNQFNRDPDSNRAGLYIEKIVTPYGDVELAADQHCPTGRIFLVRFADLKIHPLGKLVWQRRETDVNKLADRESVFGVYTMSVQNPKTMIYATGLSEDY